MSPTLIHPSIDYLPQYKAELEKGWSADNLREAESAQEQLQEILHDPIRFIKKLDSAAMQNETVTLPDGSKVPRLPGFQRWLWDGEFCGAAGFRWQEGTSLLPEHVLGHIGYSIVPGKRGLGYAKKALALLLQEIATYDLDYVQLSTDPHNIASQRVITANGGVLVKRFRKSEAYGGKEGLLFHIPLRKK